MNIQQYYNLLVETSKKGLFPSIGEFGSVKKKCLYKNKDGLKCAIGLLIPKRIYKEKFESSNLREIIETLITNKCRIPKITIDEFQSIQTCHDDTAFSSRYTWDHEYFVKKLNEVPCFKDMLQCQEDKKPAQNVNSQQDQDHKSAQTVNTNSLSVKRRKNKKSYRRKPIN